MLISKNHWDNVNNSCTVTNKHECGKEIQIIYFTL